MNPISLIFLQGGLGSNIPFIYFLIPMIIIWYFYMIRPQSKSRKGQADFMESLAKGDEVVTDSGIIGRINKIEGDILTIQLEGKNYMRVLRSSLSNAKTSAYKKD